MATATKEKKTRTRPRCRVCNRIGSSDGYCKNHRPNPDAQRPADPVPEDNCPEVLRKPVSDMRAESDVKVGREAPLTDVEGLKGMYRGGVDKLPIRTVHENAHIGKGHPDAERRMRKPYRVVVKNLGDIHPEDRARCTVKDGVVHCDGVPLTITHQSNVDAKRAEAKKREAQRLGVIESAQDQVAHDGDPRLKHNRPNTGLPSMLKVDRTVQGREGGIPAVGEVDHDMVAQPDTEGPSAPVKEGSLGEPG